MRKQIEGIPRDAMAALIQYEWPGNIRELENFIERAVILSRGPLLSVPMHELKARNESPAGSSPRPLTTLEEAQRMHILGVLEQTNWLVGGPSGAAARLGMKRTTLQSKMARLGIEPRREPEDLDGGEHILPGRPAKRGHPDRRRPTR
jgi:formate hydrogenlyase transcriptional activator